MRLDIRLDPRLAAAVTDVERLARWTLGNHEDSLRTVHIELATAGWDDWVRCRIRIRTTTQGDERLDWQGTGPDVLVCARNVLRRAERTLRRASIRRVGRVTG